MASDEQKKPTRNRENEYARDRLKRREAAAAKAAAESGADKKTRDEIIAEELAILAIRCEDDPTDADSDIDFAYKNSGNPTITPLGCPSPGAWRWWEYSRDNHARFLEICAKREDAKAKQAGRVDNQRMEDDKRQQFAVIDRIINRLEPDVAAIAKDLMAKCPEDLLNACRRYQKAWNAYFEKFPLQESSAES